MKNRKILSLLLTGAMTAALLAAPAQAADPPDAIRVSSYKGSTLEVGERIGLIIGPSGMDYTVTSSDPDTVLVEQITGFGVAVAKSEGTAEIIAANRAGGVWSPDAHSRLRQCTRQLGHHKSVGKPGDTAGADSPDQPDPQGQRHVGAACQRSPDECRPTRSGQPDQRPRSFPDYD